MYTGVQITKLLQYYIICNIQYYGKHISLINFLLTTIMSAIGTIKANIIPFTLGNQHLWVQ